MRSGADKLLVNTAFHAQPELCRALSDHFGRQCIVAGLDYRKTPERARTVVVESGARELSTDLSDWVDYLQQQGAGEILFQSMDQDGTGMGLDPSVVADLREAPEVPCILMGGVGKADHIISGLQHPAIDAVATANLFNFIGLAFLDVRRAMADRGVQMAQWLDDDYAILRDKFAAKR
jgi:cyclase